MLSSFRQATGQTHIKFSSHAMAPFRCVWCPHTSTTQHGSGYFYLYKTQVSLSSFLIFFILQSDVNYSTQLNMFVILLSFAGVKKVLAVVTYLLIVIPTVLSAPSGSMEQQQEDPFWVLNENVQPEDNITQALKAQLAKTIQTQAKIACNKANHSLEEYTVSFRRTSCRNLYN